MSALDQVKERASVPMLKDTINAALHAHAQVPTALVSDLVHVPAAIWAQISDALNSAKALHDLDLSRARVTDRMSIDGKPYRDQLIKMRVKPRPSGRGRKARSDIENVAAMAD